MRHCVSRILNRCSCLENYIAYIGDIYTGTGSMAHEIMSHGTCPCALKDNLVIGCCFEKTGITDEKSKFGSNQI